MNDAVDPSLLKCAEESLTERPYLLLTPGPLSTAPSVRAAMLRDLSTWDKDYNDLVQQIRAELVQLATESDGFTSVLMQGSGTFAVEATIGSVVPVDGKLAVVSNGAYGRRIAAIAERLRIDTVVVEFAEDQAAELDKLQSVLESDAEITHVAMVHCETTSGLLNPAESVGKLCRSRNLTFILDAMSSFGGFPIDADQWGCDYLISSANKCVQGVPGFGFVVCRQQALESTRGTARSLSLDLYDQWNEMEQKGGKWRYTSPTHTVLAFHQALNELRAEGGIAARYQRYSSNQELLVSGMSRLGFRPLVETRLHSPIITAFHCPQDPSFDFGEFYDRLKQSGFVIYPGKVTNAETFRIGTIGDLYPSDIERLLTEIEKVLVDTGWSV